MANTENKKFIVKEKRAGNEEYAIKKSPGKTIWGRILIVLIVLGTLALPIVSLIVALINLA